MSVGVDLIGAWTEPLGICKRQSCMQCRAAFAAVGLLGVAVSGCGWILGSSDEAASELVDGLVGRTWVAVDYPLPRLPMLRFDRGDSGNEVEVDGDDTCNNSSGPVRFAGNTVADAEILSTAVGCSIPVVTFINTGATLDVQGAELIVSNPANTQAPSTRYVAWESLSGVPLDEMAGRYLYGTTVIGIADATIEVGECRGFWSHDAGVVDIDLGACQPPARDGWWTETVVWEQVRRNSEGDLIVEHEDGFVHLDQVAAGASPQPTLAAFLGVVAGRTWVLDDPRADYPSAWRPFVRLALHGAPDIVPAAHGFDGCARFLVTDPVHGAGVWTPADGGWSFASSGGIAEPADDCSDDRLARLVDVTYHIVGNGQLEAVGPDGTRHILRYAASRPAGVAAGPVEHIAGTWILDHDAATVEITTNPSTIRFGDCITSWTASDQWIELEPSTCTAPDAGQAAERLSQLIRDGASLAVGMTDDLATLYLSRDLSIDTPDTTVLRLTRADARPTQ